MNWIRITLSVLTLAALLAAGSAAIAERVAQADISGHAIRFGARVPITPTGVHMDAQYFHRSSRGSAINGGLLLIGNTGSDWNPMRAGLGAQLYILKPTFRAPTVDTESDTVKTKVVIPAPGTSAAIALGGFVHYKLPRDDRVGFGGHIYYAPSIITFSALERFMEFGIRASYQVLPNATLFLGFRQIKVDYGHHYRNMDSGLHIGMELGF